MYSDAPGGLIGNFFTVKGFQKIFLRSSGTFFEVIRYPMLLVRRDSFGGGTRGAFLAMGALLA